jgi:hypothetical protein
MPSGKLPGGEGLEKDPWMGFSLDIGVRERS